MTLDRKKRLFFCGRERIKKHTQIRVVDGRTLVVNSRGVCVCVSSAFFFSFAPFVSVYFVPLLRYFLRRQDLLLVVLLLIRLRRRTKRAAKNSSVGCCCWQGEQRQATTIPQQQKGG